MSLVHGAALGAVRDRFPALRRTVNGVPAVFVDAPGGTQVPQAVIDAMAEYLRSNNANTGGRFATSRATDEVIEGARRAAGDFLNCDAGEVVFGPNTTTLAFALSRSFARTLRPGDEVIVTRLDHDANVAPWVAAAEDTGATVRWADVREGDCTLDLESLEAALSPRTRLVAFTLASNAVGTVTSAWDVVSLARAAGATVVADAVHLAPHRLIDARALDVDVLFCSPYKFFGPHLGVMYARRTLLESWTPYKVAPADNRAPDRWETGTKNHEALAGFRAAIDYLAAVGRQDDEVDRSPRRVELERAMGMIAEVEAALTRRFLEGAGSVEGLEIYGISDLQRAHERTPTFAVRLQGLTPQRLAEALGERGIFVWDGNYYALALMERLGLESSGGAVRIGFCHYNTIEEVDRVLDELRALSREA